MICPKPGITHKIRLRVILKVTSHRWPTMGASAQVCSAFRPIVPFLNMIRLKDLSNHLQRKRHYICISSSSATPTLQTWVSITTLGQKKSLLAENLMISQPVIAFSMKQRFSISVQGLHRVIRLITLLCVVQRDKESSSLHCVQRLPVLPCAEKLSACLCPWDSERKRKQENYYIHNKNT